MLKDYQNYNDIKNASGRSRGERIKPEDLDLFFYPEMDASWKQETFKNLRNEKVEISIYDMDDNLLYWNSTKYEFDNLLGDSDLVLFPSDDLISAGLAQGQYRIVYGFYRDVLGVAAGNKLFIDEISPSRKEVRILPVKTGHGDTDLDFASLFYDFSRNAIDKRLFFNSVALELQELNPLNFLNDIESGEFRILDNNFDTLITNTIAFLNKLAVEENPDDAITPPIQRLFLADAAEKGYKETFDERTSAQFQLSEVYTEVLNNFIRVVSSYVTALSSYKNFNYLMNFGENNQYVIINWKRDSVTYPDLPNSIVLKLYEPLPNEIKEKEQFWVSREVVRPVVEKIFMLGNKNEEIHGIVLRPANFDIEIAGTGRGTGFETWNTLLSTNASTSQDILDSFMSQSNFGQIDLNINYGDYSDFVFFGSAEERLANFKYKIELVETYDVRIAELRNVSASDSGAISEVVGDINRNRQNRRKVINDFDSYERFLYTTSGSQYSASLSTGQMTFWPIGEWPKQNNAKPFYLYPVTSSQANTWYSASRAIAKAYDIDNRNSFLNNTPVYLHTDDNNEDYFLFLNMVGQYFDGLWTYIKQLNTNVSNRDESIYDGMARELTYHVAKSHGFDLFSGNDNVDLWRYAFGYDITGSYHDGTLISGSYGDTSKEIWRRILNNLPYLLKTKGTTRSIKALLTCYGIPNSILTIREYGGPDPRDYEDIARKSAYIFEDFVYAVNFEGDQYVQSTWKDFTGGLGKPQSIEVRFAAAPNTSSISTHSLVHTDNWAIRLYATSSIPAGGFLEFTIGGTSVRTETYRYFDGEFHSVLLRTYDTSSTGVGWIHEIITKKSEADRIIFSTSASVPSHSDYELNSALYIGGDVPDTFGSQFTGSMQEYRLFQTALSQSTWDNHVRWPKSYNSNISIETTDEQVLRYSFDDPKNLGTDPIVPDVRLNISGANAGTAVNFDNEINFSPTTEEFAALTPQIGAGRYINNKIRIESAGLFYGELDPFRRVEKAAYDLAPIDSQRVGIYFTPLDVINRDIFATYAGLDLIGYIGDPQDIFKSRYDDLDVLNNAYFDKYPTKTDFNAFIRVIKNYDQSFFNQLKSLLPARVNATIGVLVEPHVLDRSRYAWKPLSQSRLDYSTTIPPAIEPSRSYSGSRDDYTTLLMGVTGSFETQDMPDYDTVIVTLNGSASNYFSGSDSVLDDQTVVFQVFPIQEASQSSGVVMSVTGSFTDSGSIGYPSGQTLLPQSSSWVHEWWDLNTRIYAGSFQTIDTTTDAGEPVEVWLTNPNKLIATTLGPSKLDVQ